MKNLLKFKNDPRDSYEMVKEYSAEENYYEYSGETDLPNAVTEYVTDLERKLQLANKLLKSKNQALREMLATMLEARPDELGCYKLELDRIINLKQL